MAEFIFKQAELQEDALAHAAWRTPVAAVAGPGGITALLGPTGGYLLCYPFAAALAGFLFRHARRGFPAALMGAASAAILILLLGATWLELITRTNFSFIAAQSIAPFLPGDALKVAAAAACACTFDRLRRSPQPKPCNRRRHSPQDLERDLPHVQESRARYPER